MLKRAFTRGALATAFVATAVGSLVIFLFQHSLVAVLWLLVIALLLGLAGGLISLAASLGKHITYLDLTFVQESCAPAASRLGQRFRVIVNGTIEWDGPVLQNFEEMSSTDILAECHRNQDSGRDTYLVVYDGAKPCGVWFSHIHGTERRVYFRDRPDSMLVTGENQFRVVAQQHDEGNYSISCLEFKRMITLVCL